MHQLLEKYVVSKIDNKQYCKANGQFNRHLKQNNLSIQDYYEIYYIGITPVCPYCNHKAVTFYQNKLEYAGHCDSKECMSKAVSSGHKKRNKKDIQESSKKRKQTNLEKYGIENISASKEIQKTKRKSYQKKYGVDWITKSDEFKNKAKRSKLKRHGDEFYNNSKQIKKSKALRTSKQENISNEKRRKTNLKKYGVETVLLLPENLEKSGKFNGQKKVYVFESGHQVDVMGYEPQALDILLETYNEKDIIPGSFFGKDQRCEYNLPIISYYDKSQIKRKYYPDIFIPKENRIIEVKSQWWYDGNGLDKYKSRLENNNRKRDACIALGYSFEFWIMNKDGLIEVIK